MICDFLSPLADDPKMCASQSERHAVHLPGELHYWSVITDNYCEGFYFTIVLFFSRSHQGQVYEGIFHNLEYFPYLQEGGKNLYITTFFWQMVSLPCDVRQAIYGTKLSRQYFWTPFCLHVILIWIYWLQNFF